MGGDRAAAKGLCGLPLEPGAVPCVGEDMGQPLRDRDKGMGMQIGGSWHLYLIHLDNRKNHQDSSIRRELLFLALTDCNSNWGAQPAQDSAVTALWGDPSHRGTAGDRTALCQTLQSSWEQPRV